MDTNRPNAEVFLINIARNNQHLLESLSPDKQNITLDKC